MFAPFFESSEHRGEASDPWGTHPGSITYRCETLSCPPVSFSLLCKLGLKIPLIELLKMLW